MSRMRGGILGCLPGAFRRWVVGCREVPRLPGIGRTAAWPAARRALRSSGRVDSQGRPETRAVIGVDVGGTFTDVVAIRDGQVTVTKVSSDPRRLQDAVIEGARRFGLSGSDVFNHA